MSLQTINESLEYLPSEEDRETYAQVRDNSVTPQVIYPAKCVNEFGLPGNHPAEGRLLNAQGKPISHQCRACAEEIIKEYREKLGWKWNFEPYTQQNGV